MVRLPRVVAREYPYHVTQPSHRGYNTLFSASGGGDYADAGDVDQDRKHNKANEIYDETDAVTEEEGQIAWADPARDARGNMTTVTRPASPTGTYMCTYDAWNRLMYLSCEGTCVLYQYDGLHRQICKIVADGTNWDRTDYYHTAGWQVVEERFTDDASFMEAYYNAATEPKYQYVWSLRYIDAAVLRDENTDPETDDLCDDDRLYYCNDVNMNVTALVDASGTVAERYVYNAYGEVTIHDDDWSDEVDWPDGEQNEIFYCGYRWDHKSGLYHVRYRMYHPMLGRWMQRDPLHYVEGLTLYEYVRSCPSILVDPIGTSTALVYAGKSILWRVFDHSCGPLYRGPHPTTKGPLPLVGGILWGAKRALDDADEPMTLELAVDRTGEFIVLPAAVTTLGFVGAKVTGSGVVHTVFLTTGKLGAASMKAGLYGAAFYAGFRVGQYIGEGHANYVNALAENRRDAARVGYLVGQGALVADEILYDAPGEPMEICCGGVVMAITDTGICPEDLRRAVGTAYRNLGNSWVVASEVEAAQGNTPSFSTVPLDPDKIRRDASESFGDAFATAMITFVDCVNRFCTPKTPPPWEPEK
jgi:RHS repeat-associated protein